MPIGEFQAEVKEELAALALKYTAARSFVALSSVGGGTGGIVAGVMAQAALSEGLTQANAAESTLISLTKTSFAIEQLHAGIYSPTLRELPFVVLNEALTKHGIPAERISIRHKSTAILAMLNELNAVEKTLADKVSPEDFAVLQEQISKEFTEALFSSLEKPGNFQSMRNMFSLRHPGFTTIVVSSSEAVGVVKPNIFHLAIYNVLDVFKNSGSRLSLAISETAAVREELRTPIANNIDKENFVESLSADTRQYISGKDKKKTAPAGLAIIIDSTLREIERDLSVNVMQCLTDAGRKRLVESLGNFLLTDPSSKELFDTALSAVLNIVRRSNPEDLLQYGTSVLAKMASSDAVSTAVGPEVAGLLPTAEAARQAVDFAMGNLARDEGAQQLMARINAIADMPSDSIITSSFYGVFKTTIEGMRGDPKLFRDEYENVRKIIGKRVAEKLVDGAYPLNARQVEILSAFLTPLVKAELDKAGINIIEQFTKEGVETFNKEMVSRIKAFQTECYKNNTPLPLTQIINAENFAIIFQSAFDAIKDNTRYFRPVVGVHTSVQTSRGAAGRENLL